VERISYQDGNFFLEGGEHLPLAQLPEWLKDITAGGIKPIGRPGKIVAFPCPFCYAPFGRDSSLIAHLEVCAKRTAAPPTAEEIPAGAESTVDEFGPDANPEEPFQPAASALQRKIRARGGSGKFAKVKKDVQLPGDPGQG